MERSQVGLMVGGPQGGDDRRLTSVQPSLRAVCSQCGSNPFGSRGGSSWAGRIARRAGRTGTTTLTGVRAGIGLVGLVLANPAGILAEQAGGTAHA